MSHLYTSYSGYRVDKFSFTQASDIENCPKKFQLTRIDGWASKVEPAAFKMGICVERSINEFYNLGNDPEEVFVREWGEYRDVKLDYTATDESWSRLLKIGRKLMYRFRHSGYSEKLVDPKFNVNLIKEDWYGGTSLEYILDCLSGGDRLVDIKTAGKPYPDTPLTATMRPQLRTGCLVGGFRKTAYLVFVKNAAADIQWIEGEVSDDLVHDIDLWLRAQRDRVKSGQFYRRWADSWPDQHCAYCEVRDKCLGNEEGVALNLIKRGNNDILTWEL